MVVWKVFPGIAVRGVVLTHSAPLTLRQVRAPAFPILLASLVFLETALFCGGIVHRMEGVWRLAPRTRWRCTLEATSSFVGVLESPVRKALSREDVARAEG